MLRAARFRVLAAHLRTRREPLSKIMRAVDGLGDGEALRIRATFAPVPLVGLLSERGFVYHLEEHDADAWSVWCWRRLL